MSMTQDEKRSEYIAGLRAIADALEANEDLPLPYDGTTSPMSVFTYGKSQIQAWASVMPGTKEKRVDDSKSFGFELHGSVRGVKLVIYGDRNEVCTRRVVGTREVTRTVPDPSVSVPLVEVTETEELVEWDCGPLLGASS